MKHINRFGGGVDRDTDDHLIEAGKARLMQNMRTRSVNGDTFVAVTVGGMSSEFVLTDGFLPIGYAEHEGVGFIFSHNEITGESEIGTYPSPRIPSDPLYPGYEPVYRPLQNWTGAVDPDPEITPNPVRLDLRTDLFKFSCQNPIEAQAQLTYDGSVVLFWTDFNNPLRWINTGFIHSNAEYNSALYYTGNLIKRTSVFSETCAHPRISLFSDVQVHDGGALQGGNYFFFVRYADLDFNATSFLSEIGPIQITIDSPANGVTLGGSEGLEVCNKAVTMKLSNVDSTTYPYVELAVAYFHNDTFLINRIVKYFPTIGGSSELTITITGTEELADLTASDILRAKGEVDCPKSIDQLDGKLWGANWKKSVIEYEDLNDIAQLVLAKPPDTSELLEELCPMAWILDQPPTGNQNYQKTLNTNGYFRGESYPFAFVFVFTDGRVSYPYPMKGYDAWYDPGAAAQNSKGILRFPSNNNVGYEFIGSFNPLTPGLATIRTMGVKFDTSAIPFANWSAWAQQNVCGFYIVRGQRRPNIVYQGIAARAYGGVTLQAQFDPPLGAIWGEGQRPIVPPPADPPLIVRTIFGNDESVFPEIGDSSLFLRHPMRHQGNVAMHNNGYAEGLSTGLCFQLGNSASKLGLFSTDHFFKRSMNDGRYRAVLQGRVNLRIEDYTTLNGGSSYRKPSTLSDMAGFTSWCAQNGELPGNTPTLAPTGVTETVNVPESSLTAFGNGRFTSFYAEGNQEHFGNGTPMFCFYSDEGGSFPGLSGEQAETGNREMKQRTYIGMEFVEDPSFFVDIISMMSDYAVSGTTYIDMPLVNIYAREFDPANGFSLQDEYQPELTTYYRITDILPVAAWDGLVSNVFFGGDAFINRCYHRHMHSGSYHDLEFAVQQRENIAAPPNPLTGESRYYKYGNLVGSFQECSVNTGMRLETGTSGSTPGPGKYYPKTSRAAPVIFASEFGQFEEESGTNGGYDQILGIMGSLGFDPLIPFRSLQYITRIWCSNKHLPNDLSNAYLVWDAAAYMDYSTATGPINKIAAIGDVLLSVQDGSTWIHRVNQEVMIPTDSSGAASEGRLLLGKGDVLPEKPLVLSQNVGTQHQRSVVKTQNAIWGYDQRKRKIWSCDRGGQFRLVSDELRFRTDITRVSQFLGDNSDVLNVYPDAPVCAGGVIGFWDPHNHEVGWTWRVYRQPPGLGLTTYVETLVVNEQYNVYQHKRTHHSPFYMAIGEDLYSINPDYTGPQPTEFGPIPFFRHDKPTAPFLEFYGLQERAALGWIHNQGHETSKLYNGCYIGSNDVEASLMIFRTAYQEALLNPFLSTQYWLRPIYKEHSWRLPIPNASLIFPGGNPSEFFIGSRMKGRYMYLEAQWASPLPVFVDSATTIFTPSIR